jgi:hypothetical protein
VWLRRTWIEPLLEVDIPAGNFRRSGPDFMKLTESEVVERATEYGRTLSRRYAAVRIGSLSGMQCA